MGLEEGENLRNILTFLKNDNENIVAKYPPSTFLEMMLSICNAIAYAHHKNILHLEIIPKNILLGNFHQVQIINWRMAEPKGIANDFYEILEQENMIDSEKLQGFHITDGIIRSVIHYLSPEQICSEELDERTDVYGLGCLLYTCLTYEFPVQGSSSKEIFDNIMQGKLQPLPDKIPEELRGIIIKSISLKKEDRFSNVMEFQKYLESFLNNSDDKQYSIRAKESILPRLFISLSFAFLFILILLFFQLWESRQKVDDSKWLPESSLISKDPGDFEKKWNLINGTHKISDNRFTIIPLKNKIAYLLYKLPIKGDMKFTCIFKFDKNQNRDKSSVGLFIYANSNFENSYLLKIIAEKNKFYLFRDNILYFEKIYPFKLGNPVQLKFSKNFDKIEFSVNKSKVVSIYDPVPISNGQICFFSKNCTLVLQKILLTTQKTSVQKLQLYNADSQIHKAVRLKKNSHFISALNTYDQLINNYKNSHIAHQAVYRKAWNHLIYNS